MNFWGIVAIWIHDIGQLLGDLFSWLHSKDSHRLGDEVRVGVRKYVNVEVKLEESAKGIDVPDYGLLDSNHVVLVGLDHDRVGWLIVRSEAAG